MHEAAKTQQPRASSTHAAAVSRGQGLYCLVLCVLGECVCVWSPTTSGTKGAGPAWLPLFVCGSGGVRDVHVLICTRVVQIGVALIRTVCICNGGSTTLLLPVVRLTFFLLHENKLTVRVAAMYSHAPGSRRRVTLLTALWIAEEANVALLPNCYEYY